mgnify:CR=1 FL=1|jgi:hypothetical protein
MQTLANGFTMRIRRKIKYLKFQELISLLGNIKAKKRILTHTQKTKNVIVL